MGTRILVVDDEADLELLVRQRFRKQISDKKYEVVFALNGVEALAALAHDPAIELIVTDINMPEMDGLTLLSHVTKTERLLKTVVVSAYDDMENIRTAMNRGAFDFLTKPLDFVDLEVTIEKTRRELDQLRLGAIAREQLATIQYELEVARRIQKSILPDTLAPQAKVEVSATMRPAKEVGGDFYDYFFLDPDHLGFAIGDVSGKGIPAALFMAVSRTLLRATALQGHRPAICLRYINDLLLKQSGGEIFLTLLYGMLDLRDGSVEFSVAAHCPPYWLSRAQKVRTLTEPTGMLLGVLEDMTYETGSLQLAPGDTLVLCTDGVTEAENANAEFYPASRLRAFLDGVKTESAENVVVRLVDEILGFSNGAGHQDDLTVLAVRYL